MEAAGSASSAHRMEAAAPAGHRNPAGQGLQPLEPVPERKVPAVQGRQVGLLLLLQVPTRWLPPAPVAVQFEHAEVSVIESPVHAVDRYCLPVQVVVQSEHTEVPVVELPVHTADRYCPPGQVVR